MRELGAIIGLIIGYVTNSIWTAGWFSQQIPKGQAMKLSGWGRYPAIDTDFVAPRDDAELIGIVASGCSIAHGNGRAYGDSAVSPKTTIHATFNHFLAFDRDAGLITVEAGVLLADVIKVCLPMVGFRQSHKIVTVGHDCGRCPW